MATDNSQNIDVDRQEGARLARPARARARPDRRRERLAGHQARHPPDRLEAAGRHAVHAHGRRRPQRRGVRRHAARPPDHRPVARARPATTSGGRGSGNDFGCPPAGGHNLDIALPGAARRARRNAGDAHLQVALGHRVGLRLRLRARDHRQRHRPTSRYASANGYTTPAAQNPNANGCQSQYGNGLTGSSGSYEAGTQTVDRADRAPTPTAPFVDDELRPVRPRRHAGHAALHLRHRPGPGPARLVHRRPRDQGRRHGDLRVRLRDRRPTRRSTTAAAARACRRRSECTDGWQLRLGRRGLAGRARLPARDARPLRLRPDRPGRERPRRRRPSPRACCSPTPTRTTATATSAPTTRRPRRPLDAQPEPGSDTPNLDDAAFKQGQSFSDAGAGHVDNYSDPSREDGAWRFDFDCLGFDVTSLAGAGPGPEAPGHLRPRGRRGLPHRPGLRDVQLRLGRPRTMTPRARRP